MNPNEASEVYPWLFPLPSSQSTLQKDWNKFEYAHSPGHAATIFPTVPLMNFTTILLIGITIIILLAACVFLSFMSIWLKCRLSDAPVSIPQLVAMRLRGSPSTKIAEDYLIMKKHGIDISIEELEIEYIKSRQNYQFFVDETVRQLRK